MGANFARDLASGEFGLSLERAVTIHLTANHYPPVPTSMVPVCIEAIENANEGDFSARVDLPKGITWRGWSGAPTFAIIESYHLGEFVFYDDIAEEDIFVSFDELLNEMGVPGSEE